MTEEIKTITLKEKLEKIVENATIALYATVAPIPPIASFIEGFKSISLEQPLSGENYVTGVIASISFGIISARCITSLARREMEGVMEYIGIYPITSAIAGFCLGGMAGDLTRYLIK